MQLKHAWTTYAASDERGSSIDEDFITDEMEGSQPKSMRPIWHGHLT